MSAPFRAQVRARVLDAAHEATVTRGWDRVRIGEVAAASGISRPTLYREFGSKDGVGEALVAREADRFFVGIAAVLREHRDVATGIRSAIVFTLDESADNPLLRAILTGSRDGDVALLPFLTTRSELLLGGGRALLADWVGRVEPAHPSRDVDEVVDAVVRLVVSHLVAPALPAVEVASRMERLVRRLLPGAGPARTGTGAA